MTPAERASLALWKSKATAEQISQEPALIIASKISEQKPLDEDEIERINSFWINNKADSPAAKLLAELYGGKDFNPEQVSAENDQVFIGLRVPDGVRTVIAGPASHVDEIIPLVDIGSAAGLGNLDRLQIAEAVTEVAANTEPVRVQPRWVKGNEIVWSSPEAERLRLDLLDKLNSLGAPCADRPGSMSTKFRGDVAADLCVDEARHVVVVWPGTDPASFTLNKFDTQPQVTAASIVSRPVDMGLVEKLEQLELQWTLRVSAVLSMAVSQALNKIGRLATRDGGADRDATPITAAITASREVLEAVDIDRASQATIDDALAQITVITDRHIEAIIQAIQAAYGVSVDRDQIGFRLEQGLSSLERQTLAVITSKAGSSSFGPGDSGANIEAPLILTKNFAEVVGGGNIPRTSLPTPSDRDESKNPIAKIALGIAVIGVIQKAKDLWRRVTGNDEPETAEILEDGGVSLPADSDPFSQQAIEAQLDLNIRWQWTPEYYDGFTGEFGHFPAHERFFYEIFDEPVQQRRDFVQTDANGNPLTNEDGSLKVKENLGSQPQDKDPCYCEYVAVSV